MYQAAYRQASVLVGQVAYLDLSHLLLLMLMLADLQMPDLNFQLSSATINFE